MLIFLEEELFHSKHFGFRSKRSTINALAETVEQIRLALNIDKGQALTFLQNQSEEIFLIKLHH